MISQTVELLKLLFRQEARDGRCICPPRIDVRADVGVQTSQLVSTKFARVRVRCRCGESASRDEHQRQCVDQKKIRSGNVSSRENYQRKQSFAHHTYPFERTCLAADFT